MSKTQMPITEPHEPLATLVEIVPMPLAFFDRDYRFVFANAAAAAQVDVPRDELEGQALPDLLPQAWPRLRVLFDRAFAGEIVSNLEVDPSEVSDEPRAWIGSFYPVREGDEVTAVAATAFDVTTLRGVQRELNVRNDLYAMLARVNAAASSSSNKEELFEKICQIAVEIGNFRFAWVGMPKDGAMVPVASAGRDDRYIDALGSPDLIISTDPEDERSHCQTGQAYLHGTTSFLNNYLESSHTKQWHEVARPLGIRSAAALPILEQDHVIAVLTVYAGSTNFFNEELSQTLYEITESTSHALDRIELERRRQRYEAELILRDRALSAATQGVMISDAQAGDNPIIYVTPALEDLTGYTSDEMVGQNARMLQGPETDADEVAKIREAIAADQSCEAELLNYRKNGETFWNRLTIAPIFDETGALTHFVGVQTDVTERRELERQVQQAQKMEAIGQLAGGVAHDFNNALTAIRGSVALALAEAKTSSVREDLKQIDAAAEHAANLTRQLLAFSRQQVLKPQSTDLNQVVRETTALVTRVIGDDVEVTEELDPDLDAVLVDRAQMQQVILNLCINAREAMTAGGKITIQTIPCELDEADRFVTLKIGDNGSGMDASTISKAFEPFYTTKSDGTGLGLATVYGIVSQSGGQIEIESELNVGTTFMIQLPTTTAAVEETRSAPAGASGPLDGTETILHVEDSEILRGLMARVLGRRGYKVLSAANAEQALEIARAQSEDIDLVITDIVMPGLNGRELAERLVAEHPQIRVLLTSGYSEDMVMRDEVADHEVNFIEKPFLGKDLLPLVRAILDREPSI